MKWTVTYDNDVGPNDDGFWKWWDVSDGETSFRAWDEHEAEWLCNLLNNLPLTTTPAETTKEPKT